MKINITKIALLNIIFCIMLILPSCQEGEVAPVADNKARALEVFENSLKEQASVIQSYHDGNDMKRGELTINEANEMLQPMIESSKSLLMEYDLSQEEVDGFFPEGQEANYVVVGMQVLQIEKEIANGTFDESSADESDIIDCALRATGIKGLQAILSGQIKRLGGAAIIRLVSKTASKFLGPIGTAYAVYDFIDCASNL